MSAGSSLDRRVKFVKVSDLDRTLGQERPDVKEFLATEIDRRTRRIATLPVLLGISNVGSQGIRNLYVDMTIQASSDSLEVFDSMPDRRSAWSVLTSSWWETALDEDAGPQENPWKEGLRKVESGWRLSFEWDALQPQRSRFIQPRQFIRASGDVAVNLIANVFADSFPQPVSLNATLRITTEEQLVTTRELLPDLDVLKTRHEASHTSSVVTYLTRSTSSGDV